MVVLGFVIIVLGVSSFLVLFLGLALCAGGAKIVWIGASQGNAIKHNVGSWRETHRSVDLFVRGLQVTIYVTIVVAVISAIWLFAIDSNDEKLNSIFLYCLIVSVSIYVLSMIILSFRATVVLLRKRENK